jgi:hypothetical protein
MAQDTRGGSGGKVESVMLNNIDFAATDSSLVAIAILANLLLTGIFLSRPARRERLELVLGAVFIALAAPLAGVVALNARAGRPWWTIALPIPLIQFCAFGVGKAAGLVTLGTYALNLAATWYSYSQVGRRRGNQQIAT